MTRRQRGLVWCLVAVTLPLAVLFMMVAAGLASRNTLKEK